MVNIRKNNQYILLTLCSGQGDQILGQLGYFWKQLWL